LPEIVFICEYKLLNIRMAVKILDAVSALVYCAATTEGEGDDE
jgi:hypothetical protein